MKKYSIYQDQIAGLKDLQETVKVVEKSAASRIHSLEKQVEILSEYKKGVKMVLERIFQFEKGESHALLQTRSRGQSALLIVGGDKGIVGSLYHDLISAFLENKNHYEVVWVLGGKINEYLREENIQANQIFDNTAGLSETEAIKKLSAKLFASFQNQRLKSVHVLYPKFISLVQQRPAFVKLLPLDPAQDRAPDLLEKGSAVGTLETGEGLPIFEPSSKRILTALFRDYIRVNFAQIILEAKLSQLSARTVTAEHAVSKTKDIIKNLNLLFFRERKRSITQRQLESFIGHKTR